MKRGIGTNGAHMSHFLKQAGKRSELAGTGAVIPARMDTRCGALIRLPVEQHGGTESGTRKKGQTY